MAWTPAPDPHSQRFARALPSCVQPEDFLRRLQRAAPLRAENEPASADNRRVFRVQTTAPRASCSSSPLGLRWPFVVSIAGRERALWGCALCRRGGAPNVPEHGTLTGSPCCAGESAADVLREGLRDLVQVTKHIQSTFEEACGARTPRWQGSRTHSRGC